MCAGVVRLSVGLRSALCGVLEGIDGLPDVVAVADDDRGVLELVGQVLALGLGRQHGWAARGQDDGAGLGCEFCEQVEWASYCEVADHEAAEGS